MAKNNPQNIERRAMVEKMRAEQARKEKMRSFGILGFSVAVVVALLVAALIPFIKDWREDHKPIDQIGVSLAAADCGEVSKKKASGNNQHETIGQKIDYDTAPPAFGPHWGTWPGHPQGPTLRTFYTAEDRPEVEYLVHSLEHGNTIVWYDDTITPESAGYKALRNIAGKVSDSKYLIVAPWKAADGDKFADGKHVALTHWSGKAKDEQQGVWQYCDAPSGGAIEKFMKDYPKEDAPEGGAAQNMG